MCEKIVLDIDDSSVEPIISMLMASIVEANECLTQDDAIDYVTKHGNKGVK